MAQGESPALLRREWLQKIKLNWNQIVSVMPEVSANLNQLALNWYTPDGRSSYATLGTDISWVSV